jgi:NADH dehydrogenase
MAVIGKSKAVAQIGRFKSGGFFAWMLWGVVHITFLIGFRNRLQVLISWFWNWLLNARDARLITGDSRLSIEIPRAPEYIRNKASATQTDGSEQMPAPAPRAPESVESESKRPQQ